MRLVQMMIPAGEREAVVSVLDDEEIDYVVTDETSGRESTAVVTFPLPTAAVDPVVESLRDAGVDERTYTVIVEAETVISRQFEQLEEKYAQQEEGTEDRISRAELKTKAAEFASSLQTYLIMTVVSAVIATAGLLLGSPATVVGSMVIAPLIGPAMAASVGTVVDDQELFSRGVRYQVIGVIVAIVAAAGFTAVLRGLNLVPPGLDPLAIAEIAERAMPNLLLLAVAVGAGIAGILSLMTGVSTVLVGVMIAVALIPPAAAVGIGIAFGVPRLTIGAGVLVAVNLLSINLAALVVLWLKGYRPESWFREEQARSTLFKRVGVLLIGIALLSVFLGVVTFDSYTAATTESEVRLTVESELASADGRLELLELDIKRGGKIPPLQIEQVTVTIGTPSTRTSQGLADDIDSQVEAVTGTAVTVEVRYLTVEQSQ
jgi:conserved hypothetical protein TIGR00341